MASNQKTEKRTPKYRFNAIDAFIILVVILCIVGLYFRSNIESWISSEKELEDYQVTLVVNKIKSTSGQYISAGNEVYMSSGVLLGAINGFSSFPSKTYITDTLGNSIEVSYPEDTYIDVTLLVDCSGVKNEEGFYLNGTYLLTPGTVMDGRTEMMDFTFTVTSIEKNAE